MSAPANEVADRYANQSQQTLIAVVEYLASPANLLLPRTVKDIQAGLGGTASRDQVFRTVQTLTGAGWVEEAGSGYVLAPDLTRLADRLRHKLINLHRAYLLEAEIHG